MASKLFWTVFTVNHSRGCEMFSQHKSPIFLSGPSPISTLASDWQTEVEQILLMWLWLMKYWGWSLVEILKLKFGQDSEAGFWSTKRENLILGSVIPLARYNFSCVYKYSRVGHSVIFISAYVFWFMRMSEWISIEKNA